MENLIKLITKSSSMASQTVVGWLARRRRPRSWYENFSDYTSSLVLNPGTYIWLAVIYCVLLHIYFIYLDRRGKEKEREKENAEDNKGDKKESFPPGYLCTPAYFESPTNTCTCQSRSLKGYAEEVFVEKVVESVVEKVMDKMKAEKAETELYRKQTQNFLANAKKTDVEDTKKTPVAARKALSCSGYLALLDPENKEKGRQVEIKEKQRNRNQSVNRNLSVKPSNEDRWTKTKTIRSTFSNASVGWQFKDVTSIGRQVEIKEKQRNRNHSVKPNNEDRCTKTKKIRSTFSHASVGWQFKNVLPQVAKSRKIRKKESATSQSSQTMKGCYDTSKIPDLQ